MSGNLAQDSGKTTARLNQNVEFNQLMNPDVAS